MKKFSVICLVALGLICSSNSGCRNKSKLMNTSTYTVNNSDSTKSTFNIAGKYKIGEGYLYICTFKAPGWQRDSHIFIYDKENNTAASIAVQDY